MTYFSTAPCNNESAAKTVTFPLDSWTSRWHSTGRSIGPPRPPCRRRRRPANSSRSRIPRAQKSPDSRLVSPESPNRAASRIPRSPSAYTARARSPSPTEVALSTSPTRIRWRQSRPTCCKSRSIVRTRAQIPSFDRTDPSFRLKVKWNMKDRVVSSRTIKVNVSTVPASKVDACSHGKIGRQHSCANAETPEDCESSCGVASGFYRWL